MYTIHHTPCTPRTNLHVHHRLYTMYTMHTNLHVHHVPVCMYTVYQLACTPCTNLHVHHVHHAHQLACTPRTPCTPCTNLHVHHVHHVPTCMYTMYTMHTKLHVHHTPTCMYTMYQLACKPRTPCTLCTPTCMYTIHHVHHAHQLACAPYTLYINLHFHAQIIPWNPTFWPHTNHPTSSNFESPTVHQNALNSQPSVQLDCIAVSST